jgi:hypothetical protein
MVYVCETESERKRAKERVSEREREWEQGKERDGKMYT